MSSSHLKNSEHSSAVGFAGHKRDLRRFNLSISRSFKPSRRETAAVPRNTNIRAHHADSWLIAIDTVHYVGETYGGTSEAQVREQGAIRERCGPKFGVTMILIVYTAA